MTANKQVITIAIDAMGGDFGPKVTVSAAIRFLRERSATDQHRVILIGLEAPILAAIDEYQGREFLQDESLLIHPASEVVGMDESPAIAMKRKKDSSMRVSINLVKEGQAQACVSAGNTGALMATARFVLKTIPGISRPAICSTMPCLDADNTVHMLDLGANVDSSPEVLVQFAIMGSVLTEFVDAKEKPRVALLNVGAEEIKGSDKVKKASTLLGESQLNYVGYIESNEILRGKVDVIVCDGFEGNVALKASEGTASMIFELVKQEFGRNWLTKLSAFASIPVLKAMKKRLDPRRHNGATLLGLNGIVIKSHGGTDEFGFLHAIEEASLQAELNLIEQLSEKTTQLLK